jgi:hypothetical protein
MDYGRPELAETGLSDTAPKAGGTAGLFGRLPYPILRRGTRSKQRHKQPPQRLCATVDSLEGSALGRNENSPPTVPSSFTRPPSSSRNTAFPLMDASDSPARQRRSVCRHGA